MKRSTVCSVSVALAAAFVCALMPSGAFSSSFASEKDVGALNAHASTSTSDEFELPSNVFAPEMLRPLLSEMLERSVTFRRQCCRIRNTPLLHVAIELVPTLTYDHCLAVSLVERYEYGRITIRMLITVPRASVSYAAILGHEFEHALEQIEGLDLSALASTGRSGVYRHPDGSYETTRAREAGLAVAREFDLFRKSSNSAARSAAER